jgi:hypothetical protein
MGTKAGSAQRHTSHPLRRLTVHSTGVRQCSPARERHPAARGVDAQPAASASPTKKIGRARGGAGAGTTRAAYHGRAG